MRTFAHHGYRFIRDRCWDAEYGGFYWAVDATGNRASVVEKHTLAQAFGLYAMSAYAQVSGDKEAASLAKQTTDLLALYAHDHRHGGYREFFARDWSTPQDAQTLYMGVTPDQKTANTHLHLLEAMAEFHRLIGGERSAEVLQELITIQVDRVRVVNGVVCTNLFTKDWQPLEGKADRQVLFGHDLENIWLLLEATTLLGRPPDTLLEVLLRCFDCTVQHGYDFHSGGFYAWGPVNKLATRFGKDWWVQAEALVCALYLYRYSGDSRYLNYFSHILRWIETGQVDWKRGEWHRIVTPLGRVLGNKSDDWKTPYHNGRAMLKCLQLIEELLSGERHS